MKGLLVYKMEKMRRRICTLCRKKRQGTGKISNKDGKIHKKYRRNIAKINKSPVRI